MPVTDYVRKGYQVLYRKRAPLEATCEAHEK